MLKNECKEIITIISGLGFDVNLSWINKKGNYRGEVIITLGDHGALELMSIGWSNRKIVFLREYVTYIHVYHFIGNSGMDNSIWPYVRGFAIGNIEWHYES